MPILKTTWHRNKDTNLIMARELHASSVIADAGTVSDNIDLDNVGADGVRINIDITSASGASGNVTVKVYHSTQGSAELATEEDTVYTNTIAFSGIQNKVISLFVNNTPYSKIEVTNSTGADVTYVSTYNNREYMAD